VKRKEEKGGATKNDIEATLGLGLEGLDDEKGKQLSHETPPHQHEILFTKSNTPILSIPKQTLFSTNTKANTLSYTT
jgi:hypothetical protein